MPATILLLITSFTTTTFTPIVTLFPIFILPITFAPAHILTPLSIVGDSSSLSQPIVTY